MLQKHPKPKLCDMGTSAASSTALRNEGQFIVMFGSQLETSWPVIPDMSTRGHALPTVFVERKEKIGRERKAGSRGYKQNMSNVKQSRRVG